MSLTVIVPTRGRPGSVQPMVESFAATTAVLDTRLLFVVDVDDPELDAYRRAVVQVDDPMIGGVMLATATGGTMVKALNEIAVPLARSFAPPEALGFMGDDHRPHTPGWDAYYLSALRELGSGIVYGDDLIQHDFVPTQCAMSSDIVAALGWMAHPTLRHMYVDTLWRDMAKRAGRLRYLPDVVVEHLHPIRGTAPDDEGYRRVNAPEVYAEDKAAFLAIHGPGVDRSGQPVRAEIDTIADTIRSLPHSATGPTAEAIEEAAKYRQGVPCSEFVETRLTVVEPRQEVDGDES